MNQATTKCRHCGRSIYWNTTQEVWFHFASLSYRCPEKSMVPTYAEPTGETQQELVDPVDSRSWQ